MQPDIIIAKAFKRHSQQNISVISPHQNELDFRGEKGDCADIGTMTPKQRCGVLKNAQLSKSWAFNFELPGWVFGERRAWDICARRSYSGWKVNLRVYSLRNRFDPVFRAARHGDVKTLQRLFDDGKASPFDRDLMGQTLAHVSKLVKSLRV